MPDPRTRATAPAGTPFAACLIGSRTDTSPQPVIGPFAEFADHLATTTRLVALTVEEYHGRSRIYMRDLRAPRHASCR